MTDISHAVLPLLAGYSWRAPDPATDAASLAALTAAADHADNNEILLVPVPQPRDLVTADLTIAPSLCAVTDSGEIAGAAWVAFEEGETEFIASLHGRVHPAHRRKGIGAALLRWSEAAARERLAGQPKAIRLFIRNETLSDDARKIYAQAGIDLLFIEHIMRRSLSEPLPDFPIPVGVSTRVWAEDLIPEFYSMYNATFAERPGFPGWDFAAWLDWIAGDEDFRADLSWLAYENEQPIGFLISTVDPAGRPHRAGWIAEIGTHPAMRNKGISASLLVKAIAAYRAEGLNDIALMVNDNNPKAQALYRKVGLDVFRYRGKYEKRLESLA